MADKRELFNRVRAAAYRSAVIVEELRAYNLDAGVREYRKLLGCLQEVAQLLLAGGGNADETGISVSADYLVEMMKGLLGAQEQKDYVLLADLLELQAAPFLRDVLDRLRVCTGEDFFPDYFEANLEALRQNEPALAQRLADYRMPDDGTYVIEPTSGGYVTCCVNQGGSRFYLHSNHDPYAEARAWTRELLEEDAECFHVLGCGLGYHGVVLYAALQAGYPVHVYEEDIRLLWLAMHYCNMAGPLRGMLYLHEDPGFRRLAAAIGQPGQKLCIHYPSLRLIENEEIRHSFERFFLKESSQRNARLLLRSNFAANLKSLSAEPERFRMADELRGCFSGRTVFLVGAGPSLDKNIGLLAEAAQRENGLVVACGTVFRKLLRAGIHPDYVIVTDANERVISQINGVESADVPMLMLSTANHGFASRYGAVHYMLFQEGYPSAEHEAQRRGCMCFQTGGSVMTTALDAAIRLGAGKLVFVGLDLAFTDHLAHAEGTSNRIATNEEDLIEIKAWDGTTVRADQKFVIYRTWMERRLREKDAEKLCVINATEGGSYIKGMRHISLADVCGCIGGEEES